MLFIVKARRARQQLTKRELHRYLLWVHRCLLWDHRHTFDDDDDDDGGDNDGGGDDDDITREGIN